VNSQRGSFLALVAPTDAATPDALAKIGSHCRQDGQILFIFSNPFITNYKCQSGSGLRRGGEVVVAAAAR